MCFCATFTYFDPSPLNSIKCSSSCQVKYFIVAFTLTPTFAKTHQFGNANNALRSIHQLCISIQLFVVNTGGWGYFRACPFLKSHISRYQRKRGQCDLLAEENSTAAVWSEWERKSFLDKTNRPDSRFRASGAASMILYQFGFSAHPPLDKYTIQMGP